MKININENSCFVKDCLENKAKPEDIVLYWSYWSRNAGRIKKSCEKFMGFTREEAIAFTKAKNNINFAIKLINKKRGIHFEEGYPVHIS
jgi:hypothetical protein